jgi:predicted RNase H-related nuclease YkuK (DUF458 family)
MNDGYNFKWRRLNGDKLDGSIVDRVSETLLAEKNKGHRLKVCIGTDSLQRSSVIDFATVIVFLRENRGGFMFISNEKVEQKMSLKERMVSEVARSVDIAYRLCDLLDRFGVELEVHADINKDPEYKSHIALKEAMGYIRSMGFVFKAKPDAFASSSCADKCI